MSNKNYYDFLISDAKLEHSEIQANLLIFMTLQ